MIVFARLALALCVVVLAVGCDSGIRPEETIEVKQPDPMLQVKSTLQNYVNGQPVTSEVTSYDYMVAKVRKVDPAKADILKTGLDEIKNSPAGAASKAKSLMKKLGI
jgi:hypothetical protein